MPVLVPLFDAFLFGLFVLETVRNPQRAMIALKSTFRIFVSPQATKPVNEEPKKIIFFSPSCSSQFFNDVRLSLNAKFSAETGKHLLPVKAVTGDDRDLVRAGRSDEEDGEKTFIEEEVEGKAGTESTLSYKYDRLVNAAIVLGAGTLAITKLLTIDHNYWHGWTLYEVLRYAPEHNWIAYEEALKSNPVFAKMVISGIVYSVGDWIAQCYEGKPLLEFDRKRMSRSGIVGFLLHGSLSHYYYHFCEALFPFNDWWVVPAKVAFDQTLWSGLWNCIYFALLGLLRQESPANVLEELKETFWPMLTAGWKLWPLAHLITYGVIPVEQRLLWVDCVELIWVTILSGYSNEKSEARISEVLEEAKSSHSSKDAKD